MASDVKFQVNKAASDQDLIPAVLNEEFEKKYVKKAN